VHVEVKFGHGGESSKKKPGSGGSEPIKKAYQKATKIPKAKFPSEGKWGISKYKLRFGVTEVT